ncbi:hypothetical protein OS175_07780 [Marinicella sp. S1101]|uniref:hypothetical protein n=1 Tax=Marinicella marina TaxID=2996016 RepID=UPI0022609FF1|nr:hypothetical protein [Marinicella marina]MCX7553774.1 hypothetical protein [Marinicella marina]MDJ1140849.1 hypothetical protein [Marinicella marina]
MKKTTIIILMLSSSMTFAKDATQLKDDAMRACAAEVAGVPEDMQAKTQKLCECKVNKTDYAAVLEAQQSGDSEKVRGDALKVAAECAKEHG